MMKVYFFFKKKCLAGLLTCIFCNGFSKRNNVAKYFVLFFIFIYLLVVFFFAFWYWFWVWKRQKEIVSTNKGQFSQFITAHSHTAKHSSSVFRTESSYQWVPFVPRCWWIVSSLGLLLHLQHGHSVEQVPHWLLRHHCARRHQHQTQERTVSPLKQLIGSPGGGALYSGNLSECGRVGGRGFVAFIKDGMEAVMVSTNHTGAPSDQLSSGKWSTFTWLV